MRRLELECNDPAFFQAVAAAVPVGYLALVRADGVPRAVALNFAIIGERIYFHGAQAGEKWDLARGGAPAGFTLVDEYSFIPSHFTAPDYACPATHFFKSVEVRGTCVSVDDPDEKAAALSALMAKYQPEGGYRPIDPQDPGYRRAVAGVGVFRLEPESWSGKSKFGRNEPARVRRRIIERLRERGGPRDAETADEIERTLEESL